MILVTGGAGFIGSHLVEHLLNEGESVICLDDFNDYYDPQIKRQNLSMSQSNSALRLIEGDIRDRELVDSVFDISDISTVVHLAARAGVRPSIKDPLLYQDVNIRGTLNLLEACKKSKIERFIFASSSSVYGANKKIPFSEEDRVDDPISPYAATKRAGELLCRTYQHLFGIQMTCLRFFTVYGPRNRPDMAIHKFAKLIDNGEKIPMFGDGTTKRDYTYISDIISGVMGAIKNPLDFEIINLGESRVVELSYLISLIEQNLGKKAVIEQLPEQPGDVPITYADINKAKSLIGYRPKVSIEDGISAFTEWYLRQKEAD